MIEKLKCLIISDFTVDNFSGYISNDEATPLIETISPGFNQVHEVLTDLSHDIWNNNPEIAVIWTHPENMIKSFKRALNYEKISMKEILEEVREFAGLVNNISDRLKYIFIPSWVIPSYKYGFSINEMKKDTGISNILAQMNLELASSISDSTNIYILDTQRWLMSVGERTFNPKLWYMAKIPFDNKIFIEATKDIKAGLRALLGLIKKLIILDLDNTLWGGIIGEVGWDKIRLGGHDEIGEAFSDFQKSLKALKNKGIMLGIVSKNDENYALEAIDKNPEMILKKSDISGYRINWNDKAENILSLIEELNLDIASAVFIDDNPSERSRVRNALPGILVPDWPINPMQYCSALFSLDCFDNPVITEEDRRRTEMYIAEKNKNSLKLKSESYEDWLKSLNISVYVEELNDKNLLRTLQLLNKTNQMNLSTRRLSERELLEWSSKEKNRIWIFRATDKFDDSGITGIVSIEIEDEFARIVDFVLSCRVMGKKIEEVMVSYVADYALTSKLKKISAKYIKTDKNSACLAFWKKSGFKQEGNTFIWHTSKKYIKPEFVKIIET